jgi:hypothetical protein
MGASGACAHEMCEAHTVSEFEDSVGEDRFTLCPYHARYQVKAGESMPDYFARIKRDQPVFLATGRLANDALDPKLQRAHAENVNPSSTVLKSAETREKF